MPGIGALVTLISLDVTNDLVGAGYVAETLPISDASNASPIVLASSAPHGYVWPVNVVVAGATGNAAANGLWLAVPTDPTHLALYAVDAFGVQTASVGSGAYTGGATVSLALKDGRILIGRQHVYEASSAPRIVFVPLKSKWMPKSVYTRTPASAVPSPEQQRQWANRSIYTEAVLFEVHVWGQATPPDPEGGDFDATQVLYQQVARSLQHQAPGSFELVDVDWTDQKATGSQLVRAGHEAVFGLVVNTPVLDLIAALPYVPPGTAPSAIVGGTYPGPGVYMENPGGTPTPP